MSLILKLAGILFAGLAVAFVAGMVADRDAEQRRTEIASRLEQTRKPQPAIQPAQPIPPPAPRPTWQYNQESDAMGRGTIRTAWLQSENLIVFDFPYNEPQRASLILRKHPKHGHDVMLRLERGQFVCGIDDCYVQVRFGTGKASAFKVLEPSDHSSNVVFISNVPRFIKGLKATERVAIEATFYREGNRTMQFNTAALTWN